MFNWRKIVFLTYPPCHTLPSLWYLPFQFAESRLDPLSQNSVHHEILEEKSLPRIAISLEDVEVAIVGDFAADGANFFRIEEFQGGALELLSLQVFRGAGPQRPAHAAIVNTRQQAQMDLKTIHKSINQSVGQFNLINQLINPFVYLSTSYQEIYI